MLVLLLSIYALLVALGLLVVILVVPDEKETN